MNAQPSLFDASEPQPQLKPQTEAIWHHIQERGSITKREAAELFGCWNLPGRIFEIRERFGAGSVISAREANVSTGTHVRYRKG